jgi:hypothetical protein
VIKKVLTVLAIAFAAYYIIVAPAAAASLVASAGALVVSLFESIITFFSALF